MDLKLGGKQGPELLGDRIIWGHARTAPRDFYIYKFSENVEFCLHEILRLENVMAEENLVDKTST